MQELLPPLLTNTCYSKKDPALETWSKDLPASVSTPADPSSQKAWEEPKVTSVFDSLLATSDQTSRARLLAASSKESGAWLHAPPIFSLGLRLCDDTVRVSIGLRVGAPLCQTLIAEVRLIGLEHMV